LVRELFLCSLSYHKKEEGSQELKIADRFFWWEIIDHIILSQSSDALDICRCSSSGKIEVFLPPSFYFLYEIAGALE
jgi:hypothetical protein